MGQALGKGSKLMGPSKLAERIVGFFLPPARREEVLGDLHERYRSPSKYAWDAITTVPLVIASGIQRTADAHLLLIQALVLYAILVGAAWLWDRELLQDTWGLVRLAVPPAILTLGSALQGAYARPEGKLARGPSAWLKQPTRWNRYLLIALATVVLVIAEILMANSRAVITPGASILLCVVVYLLINEGKDGSL
jgi:hypothetical protein